MVEPELMGHVPVPVNRKQVISPRLFIQLEVHLGGVAHRRWKRITRRETKCVLHSTGSLADEIEEEFQGDLSKPRKVHNKTAWKRAQDAVYWIHLAKEQEKGKTF